MRERKAFSTSSITSSGVDAPDASPILLNKRISFGNSVSSSIKKEGRLLIFAVLNSLFVFAEFLPPTIKIASTLPNKLFKASCLSDVAGQIVLKTTKLFTFSFRILEIKINWMMIILLGLKK